MTRTELAAAAFAAAIGFAMAAAAREDGHGHHHHGHGAHEHGVADLTIAVDGAVVELELESPAINLVGFEHRPRTDAEHKTLDAVVAALRDGGGLIAFEPAGARCVLRRAAVLSALLDDVEDEDEHHDDHNHADIFTAWRFECTGAVVNGADLRGLFSRFPATERLRVQAVSEQGQTARELTAASSRIRW